MSQVRVSGNASGTGVLTLTSPNTNSNYTLTLPANTGTLVTNATAGTLIQVVNVQSGTYASTTAVIPLDNTIPQNTEGTEYFTLSITPTSATSKLFIQVSTSVAITNSGWGTIALFQDTTANALAVSTGYTNISTAGFVLALGYYMTAGTTSTTTFKLRYGPSGNTMVMNGSGGAGNFGGTTGTYMTIMEIAA